MEEETIEQEIEDTEAAEQPAAQPAPATTPSGTDDILSRLLGDLGTDDDQDTTYAAEEEATEEEEAPGEPSPQPLPTAAFGTPITPILTDEELQQAAQLFDQDQLNLVTQIVQRTVANAMRAQAAARQHMRSAGLTDAFLNEFETEMEHALSYMPAELRASRQGVELAVVGAIAAKAQQTGDMAKTLRRAADLLSGRPHHSERRGGRRPNDRHTEVVPAPRAPAPAAPRRSGSPTRSRYTAQMLGISEAEWRAALESER